MKKLGQQPVSPPVLAENEEPVLAGDQTRFAEELPMAANTTVSAVVTPDKTTSTAQRSPRTKWLIGIAVLFALLLMVTALSLRRRPASLVLPTPVPAGSSGTATTNSELEKRLQQLETDVTNADPALTPLAFPPLNFSYALEDATARMQRLDR